MMMMVGVDVFDFVRLMMILSVKVQLYGGELRIRSTRPFSIYVVAVKRLFCVLATHHVRVEFVS